MGSSRSCGKEKGNQVKANWTPENHELFVDLCLEQISVGNRPGTYLNKEGWKNVMESFRNITGLKYDKIQLKNHWDSIKKHWSVWHRLVTTENMKWDPDTRMFGASDQEWDEYLGGNPNAATFRSKELQLADKLDIMFGGTTESGQTNRPTRRRKHENYATEIENSEHIRKHQNWSNHRTLPIAETAGARPDSNIERCYDAVESRSVMTIQSPPPKLCYSIEECIKCLDSVEELEQGSELYLFALDIFLKKEYREIFLNLKKSSTRIAWLERMQSVGPPLPLH